MLNCGTDPWCRFLYKVTPFTFMNVKPLRNGVTQLKFARPVVLAALPSRSPFLPAWRGGLYPRVDATVAVWRRGGSLRWRQVGWRNKLWTQTADKLPQWEVFTLTLTPHQFPPKELFWPVWVSSYQTQEVARTVCSVYTRRAWWCMLDLLQTTYSFRRNIFFL